MPSCRDAGPLRAVLAIEDRPNRGEVRIIPLPEQAFQTWVQAQPLSRAQRAAMESSMTWLDPEILGSLLNGWLRRALDWADPDGGDAPDTRRALTAGFTPGSSRPVPVFRFTLLHNPHDESRAELTLERLALGVRAVFALDVPDSPHAPGLGRTVPRPAERQASADPTATYLQVAAVAWEQERLHQVFASEGTLVPTVAPRARL